MVFHYRLGREKGLVVRMEDQKSLGIANQRVEAEADGPLRGDEGERRQVVL